MARKQTAAGGIRKMTETSLELVDFTRKFGLWPVGFPDMLSRHRHPGPRHVAIIQTDRMRPEMEADGR